MVDQVGSSIRWAHEARDETAGVSPFVLWMMVRVGPFWRCLSLGCWLRFSWPLS